MIWNRSGGASRGLPLGRDRAARSLSWIFALMVFVAGLGAVGLVAIGESQRRSEHAFAAAMTLEVPADASPARLQTVLALLRQTRGIVSVRLLTPAETAKLLEPWLGPAVQLEELPMPRLIDLRTDPAATLDFATLHKQLDSVAPQARLDDHRRWLDGMRAAARRIRIVLDACIAVGLLSIAPAAIFATGSALSGDRALIEIVHLLGALDRDIARPFAIRALRLGLSGGAIGGTGVLLTIVGLGGAGAIVEPPTSVAPIGMADWRLWAVLVVVALSAGLIAAASAQVAVLRRLAEMP